jgi:hypothetical protein
MSRRDPAALQTAVPDHKNLPRGWRWLGKLLILSVIRRNQWRTWKTERKRIPVLDSTIGTFREQQYKARERGLVHVERVYNVGLYVLLMDRDFSILKFDMVSTFDKWRLRFTARQIALLLYEACDDLSSMLGKEFRESLMLLETNSASFDDFNRVTQQLNRFKNSNHQFLYHDIRNLLVGHRSQDSLEFLRALEALDPMQIFRLGAEFFDIIHLLITFLIQATERIGNPKIALKHLLASPKFIASLDSRE